MTQPPIFRHLNRHLRCRTMAATEESLRLETATTSLGRRYFTTLIRTALRARTMRTNRRPTLGACRYLSEDRFLQRRNTLAFTTFGHTVLRTCHFLFSLPSFLGRTGSTLIDLITWLPALHSQSLQDIPPIVRKRFRFLDDSRTGLRTDRESR